MTMRMLSVAKLPSVLLLVYLSNWLTSATYVDTYPGSETGWPPVILSAPHGGFLSPSSIPDRDYGCWDEHTASCLWTHTCTLKNVTKCKATTDGDYNTIQLTTYLRHDLTALFGGYGPAIVINNLIRAKFDANRDEPEATFGVPEVQRAFMEYNDFIDRSKQLIVARRGFGLFIDIHGHGHPLQRAELGYLPRGTALDSGTPILPNQTSINSLAARQSALPFDSLLRGNVSFGAFLESYGFASVPSPKNPGPGAGNLYFNGGYLTHRHGSQRNGTVDAIQIESARSPRNTHFVKCYARALACTIHQYVCAYYRTADADEAPKAERESCTGDSWDICTSLDCGAVSTASGRQAKSFLAESGVLMLIATIFAFLMSL